MTWPDHLLTLEEFDQLPEDNSRRYELQEGVLHVTPKAASLHQRVVGALVSTLNRQLAHEWEAVADVEVVVTPGWPPTLRVPDLVIASTSLIDQNPNRLHAKEVLVAVEVVSPGSGRTDRVLKMFEYAKAGIPFYWIVELAGSVTLADHRLIDDVYEVVSACDSSFETIEPFELSIDLDSLARRSRRAPS
ncbi:Uma2 family endonuclease [Saccharopolyspora hattusasensis]|uniref:Uma2 family endonuclease n=1 Tax=Saccharopolyspora hattusasensis TaxID=1128679 RepID=UPI003D97D2C6